MGDHACQEGVATKGLPPPLPSLATAATLPILPRYLVHPRRGLRRCTHRELTPCRRRTAPSGRTARGASGREGPSSALPSWRPSSSSRVHKLRIAENLSLLDTTCPQRPSRRVRYSKITDETYIHRITGITAISWHTRIGSEKGHLILGGFNPPKRHSGFAAPTKDATESG